MRLLIVAFAFILAGSSAASSQTSTPVEGWSMVFTDTLRVYDSLWSWTGFKYKYGDQGGDVGLGAGPVKRIVANNPAAYAEVRKFAYYEVTTFITTLGSAGVLGWGLGSDDDDLVIAGAIGLGVSFIFDRIGYSHLKKGVKIFNAELRATPPTSERKTSPEILVTVAP